MLSLRQVEAGHMGASLKAFVQAPPVRSRSIGRVADALERYAPSSVEIVTDQSQADLVVLHVLGRFWRTWREAAAIESKGQQYAMVQYVLGSTQVTDPWEWRNIWKRARLTWSYLDLPQALIDSAKGYYKPGSGDWFYHSPLGVDADVFQPQALHRRFVMCSSGFARTSESVKEIAKAAATVGREVFHLGPKLTLGPHVTFGENLTDQELAHRYSQCEFVSGLRRIEGFELPAAEGLLCGARPILFARSSGYDWYKPWGIYIEEGDRAHVQRVLEYLFKQGADPVTPKERAEAADVFSWARVVGEFWKRCLA